MTSSPMTSAVDLDRVGDDLGMIREQAELLSLALDGLQARGASGVLEVDMINPLVPQAMNLVQRIDRLFDVLVPREG